MTAALGLGVVLLALVSLYVAGQLRDAVKKVAQLEADLALAKAAGTAMRQVADEEQAARDRELVVIRRQLEEATNEVVSCADPTARRERLRGLLAALPGPAGGHKDAGGAGREDPTVPGSGRAAGAAPGKGGGI